MHVLVTDHFTTDALLRLKSELKAEITQSDRYPDEKELASAEALLIRSRTKVDANLLAIAQKLKYVVTATSGIDHIDLKACEARGIQVMHTPDAQTEAAAELTIMLMLSTLRRLSTIYQAMREVKWKDAVHKGFELKNRTVGIVGLGRVGSRVAEILKGFGANVIAYDPYQSDDQFTRLGLKRLSITEVFVQSQILTLHVPLTPETRHMLNGGTLEMLDEECIVINTSRGAVIDEGDLVRALETGTLAAAGLDVFENEPLGKETRLRKLKNVVLTPHVGAYTEESFNRASHMAVEHLIAAVTQGQFRDSAYEAEKRYQQKPLS